LLVSLLSVQRRLRSSLWHCSSVSPLEPTHRSSLQLPYLHVGSPVNPTGHVAKCERTSVQGFPVMGVRRSRLGRPRNRKLPRAIRTRRKTLLPRPSQSHRPTGHPRSRDLPSRGGSVGKRHLGFQWGVAVRSSSTEYVSGSTTRATSLWSSVWLWGAGPHIVGIRGNR
jgi:hypothetical protein